MKTIERESFCTVFAWVGAGLGNYYVKLLREKTTITRLRVKIDAINLTIINTSLPFRSFPTGLITTFEHNSLHDVLEGNIEKYPIRSIPISFSPRGKPFCFPQFPGFSRRSVITNREPRGLIVNHFEKDEGHQQRRSVLGKKNIDENSIFRNCTPSV